AAGHSRQILRDEAKDFTERDRGQRKVRAPQPERDAPDEKREDNGDDDAHQQRKPGRQSQPVREEGQPVGAGPEVGRVSKGELTGISADEMPREAERSEEVNAE